MKNCTLILLTLALLVGIVIYKRSRIEGFRDPLYMNVDKVREWQMRTNGSIYGTTSHIMSGYAYYNSAY
jgi:hypothetical protein